MAKIRNQLLEFILIIGFVDISVQQDNTQFINNETLLIEQLFLRYNPIARPVLDTSKAVDINMMFHVTSIKDVDTKSQTITLNGVLFLLWTDERLRWNSSEYNLGAIVVPPTMVWLPSVVVHNTADDNIYNTHWKTVYEVKIYSDGSMIWGPAGNFQANCALDIKYFPFDEQICNYNFGFWIHDSDQTLLHAIEGDALAVYNENDEWEIVNHSTVRSNISTKAPVVVFSLHIRRRHLFYTANVILVTLFLGVLVLMVFKLPVESGEKISMGVTLLLAFSVFILMVNDYIPESSMSIPIIIIYLLAFMGFSTLGICESVFVIYCYHHEGKSPPPQWLETTQRMCLHICKTYRRRRKEKWIEPVKNEKEDKKEDDIPVNVKNREKWQKIGFLTDQICFWLYAFVFTVLILVTLVIVPKMGRLQLE